jgi:hypothetical protein
MEQVLRDLSQSKDIVLSLENFKNQNVLKILIYSKQGLENLIQDFSLLVSKDDSIDESKLELKYVLKNIKVFISIQKNLSSSKLFLANPEINEMVANLILSFNHFECILNELKNFLDFNISTQNLISFSNFGMVNSLSNLEVLIECIKN